MLQSETTEVGISMVTLLDFPQFLGAIGRWTVRNGPQTILQQQTVLFTQCYITAETENHDRDVNILASYLGSAGLESLSRDQQTWLRGVVILLSPPTAKC
jgi:hypothetical protein